LALILCNGDPEGNPEDTDVASDTDEVTSEFSQDPLEADYGSVPPGVCMVTRSEGEGSGTVQCSENYSYASCYEEDAPSDSEWVVTNSFDASDEVFFVEIGRSAAGPVLLMDMGDVEVLPGSLNDAGAAKFEWSAFEDNTNHSEHSSGYAYREVPEAGADFTFNLTFSDVGIGTGSLEIVESSLTRWEESDRWTPDSFSGLSSYSQMPWNVSNGLENETQAGDGRQNTADRTECDDEICFFQLTNGLTTTYTVEAVWYGPASGNIENYNGFENPNGL